MTEAAGGDELEGEDTKNPSWGDYPIDHLLIQTRHLSIREAVRKIGTGGFVMDPEFQRDFVWETEKQSRLIESVVMRIPLPVLYLAEDEMGRYVVVDGLQRLTTFQRLLEGNLKLKLPDRPELDQRKFDELPPKLKTRIEDTDLTLYILDSKAPERARLDIFERVNGGVPLTRQQMRNCLYMGPATAFLRNEAKNELFRLATGGSLKSLTMKDREFINRFCAFRLLPLEDYKDDIDLFLAHALKRMNNPSTDLAKLSAAFRRSLENNLLVFGKHSFRKHTPDRAERSILNLALFDVMATGLADYEPSYVATKASAIASGLQQLMADPVFVKSITYGTNGATQVRIRFERSRAMIEEVLGAPGN